VVTYSPPPIELTGQLEPGEPIVVPKISDALMETYLWLSGYEDETQGPCASRCIIDAAAKFACAASRNDRRTISGHKLNIDSLPACTARTLPGREPWAPRPRGCLSSPPVITDRHWLRCRRHILCDRSCLPEWEAEDGTRARISASKHVGYMCWRKWFDDRHSPPSPRCF
jgi:hypothetical protein